MQVRLDLNKSMLFGWMLNRFNFSYKIDYFDRNFYPEFNCNDESTLNYFFFMVLMDYGFSSSNFYGYIDGKYYDGSKLFWRLGKLKYDEDPQFFSPDYIIRMDENVFKSLFKYLNNINDLKLSLRFNIARKAAKRVLDEYGGSILNIVYASSNSLYCNGSGFVERLKIFKGFDDPVECKPLLLAKILLRRRLISFYDVKSFHVPVDGKISLFALRIGLVYLDDIFMEKYFSGILTLSEDYALRIRVREALDFVSSFSDVDPLSLHDLLDLFTEYCCTENEPKCISKCTEDVCPFSWALACGRACPLINVCKFNGKDINNMREPFIQGNIYY